MPSDDLEYEDLIKRLADNFNALADEVQLLSDRKIILEHKLRFAHEQYQLLADKYAAGDPEISATLAKLQLPSDLQGTSSEPSGFVTLPLCRQKRQKSETSVIIRDGQRAAQSLAALTRQSSQSTVSGRSISGASSNLRHSARRTSLSTVLEQDFTVLGRKSSLHCPFSNPVTEMDSNIATGGKEPQLEITVPPRMNLKDPTPHRSADPICAALYADTMNSPPPSATGSGAKCPIRFLGQHSPEEVARYFEIHKHEIPRSHEICVKRYQRNDDDIRKLDAKYGNFVSMIQGLGQKHQPMLPETRDDEEDEEDDKVSNERVENWAQNISVDGIGQVEEVPASEAEADRESRFDRLLKEIRVGESPSRPWGIAVPITEPLEGQRPESPPPAPVSVENMVEPVGKCPVAHGNQIEVDEPHVQPQEQERSVGKRPLPHTQKSKGEKHSNPPSPPATQSQPTFIDNPGVSKSPSAQIPQMIFTGPVFIGYPIEQAIAFMQQYKG